MKNNKKIVKKKIIGLAIGALLVALSSVAQAQSKVPRIGILFIGSRDQPHLPALKQGLRERGYIEGKDIIIEYRYADGRYDRLPER